MSNPFLIELNLFLERDKLCKHGNSQFADLRRDGVTFPVCAYYQPAPAQGGMVALHHEALTVRLQPAFLVDIDAIARLERIGRLDGITADQFIQRIKRSVVLDFGNGGGMGIDENSFHADKITQGKRNARKIKFVFSFKFA